ncbi:MAG: hypothetical protein ABJQ29_12345 [Luteolibacter sp.]
MEMSKKSIDVYTEKLRQRNSQMTGRRARGGLSKSFGRQWIIAIRKADARYDLAQIGSVQTDTYEHQESTSGDESGDDRPLAAPHKIDSSKERLPPKSENAIKALVEIRAES